MGKYGQYKESVFTHEEMQPMIIETDMTDIVERLLLKKTLETVEDVHVLFADAADEIERLREALYLISTHPVEQSKQWEIGAREMQKLARLSLGEKE